MGGGQHLLTGGKEKRWGAPWVIRPDLSQRQSNASFQRILEVYFNFSFMGERTSCCTAAMM